MNEFLSCVEQIYYHTKKPVIAIYISNTPLSPNAQNKITMKKQINANITYKYISSDDQNNIINKFQHYLHEIGIYLYENDGTAIMLN
jgi:hypothetical protein